jgi:hypothetical protein
MLPLPVKFLGPLGSLRPYVIVSALRRGVNVRGLGLGVEANPTLPHQGSRPDPRRHHGPLKTPPRQPAPCLPLCLRPQRRRKASISENETCLSGSPARQDRTATPEVLPRLTGYPGTSRRSTLCEMCQSLPWLFSQLSPLYDVQALSLFALAVLPSVRCPRFLPDINNRYAQGTSSAHHVATLAGLEVLDNDTTKRAPDCRSPAQSL